MGGGEGDAPGLGERHRGAGVDEAEAVVVGEVHAAAVPGGGVVEGPGVELVAVLDVVDGRAAVAGGERQDVLHVAPAEAAIGLQDERLDAGHLGRGGGGAAEGLREVGAVVAERAGDVVRHDAGRAAAGGSVDEQRRAGIRIVGDPALVVRRADHDGVAIHREAVGLRRQAVLPVVAGRHRLDGAEAAAAEVRAGLEAVQHPVLRAGVELADGERRREAPGVVGDVELVLLPDRLPGIGLVRAEDVDRRDLGVVCDAHRARAVARGGDQAGHGGGVLVRRADDRSGPHRTRSPRRSSSTCRCWRRGRCA